MKTRFLKSFTMEHKQRYGVALLLCVCLLLVALAPGAAQVRTPRRVTALQLGGAAEGSKVTILSDVALNDYEAFRRGDRFFVKIPFADFASALPHLRADGFEDVQVQKVGDGLMVSFKLQPGATARVDQRANRLDVVFTAANRSAYLNSARGSSQVESSPVSSDRGRDAAGPVPVDSAPVSRDRFVSDSTVSGREQQRSQNPWTSTNPQSASGKSASGKNSPRSSTSSSASQTPGKNAALGAASPAPVSSPTSILTPGTGSIYTPPVGSTPAVSPSLQPGAASSGILQNWKQRWAMAVQWAKANRLATLLGLLILLSLIVYLVLALRSRQPKVVKAKQAKTPKVKPKYSAGTELKELPPAAPQEKKDVAATAARGSQTGSSHAANAAAAAASVSHNASHSDQRVLTRPTIVTPIVTPDEHREEEEREVFEL